MRDQRGMSVSRITLGVACFRRKLQETWRLPRQASRDRLGADNERGPQILVLLLIIILILALGGGIFISKFLFLLLLLLLLLFLFRGRF